MDINYCQCQRTETRQVALSRKQGHYCPNCMLKLNPSPPNEQTLQSSSQHDQIGHANNARRENSEEARNSEANTSTVIETRQRPITPDRIHIQDSVTATPSQDAMQISVSAPQSPLETSHHSSNPTIIQAPINPTHHTPRSVCPSVIPWVISSQCHMN